MTTPARRMPPMKAVEETHGVAPATCIRCGRAARCEKAHVIDRVAFPVGTPVEVLDAVENIVPLCVPCHRSQPGFRPGEEGLAWAWMRLDATAYARSRWETEVRAASEGAYRTRYGVPMPCVEDDLAVRVLAGTIAAWWAEDVADPAVLPYSAVVARALAPREGRAA